jgi:transcriptional regulator of acetoin/glycerol metabolism
VGASWGRCAQHVPTSAIPPVLDTDPAESWEASPLRQAATPYLDDLTRLALLEDYVVAITGSQGEILWSAAGNAMARHAESANFVQGSAWNEAAAGTNAPGLTLMTGVPSTVFADEHWCEGVRDWVCYAAPIVDSMGTVVGVLDLSSTWRRASPLALTTVVAFGKLISQAMPHETLNAGLSLSVLGHTQAYLDGHALQLSLRQYEVLTMLGMHGELKLNELYDALYGERKISPVTLRAEMSHLRHVLGGRISSRSYHLELPVRIDAHRLLSAAKTNDATAVCGLYRGPLLPNSESPRIRDLRHQIDAVARRALLDHGSPSELMTFAEYQPWDREILERAAERSVRQPLLHERAVALLHQAG